MGSGPTRDDLKAQEPLSGNLARELIAALQEAGIDKDRLLVMNAYACQATEPKRDVEERKAVACCRPLLESYVSQIPPETPTLLAGKWAQLALEGSERGLFGKRGFTYREWRLDDAIREDTVPEEDLTEEQ